MPFKIDKQLSDAEGVEFEALIKRPGTTGVAAHRWLRDRGHDVSVAAVQVYIRRHTPDRPRTRRPLKIDRLMRDEDRAPLEKLIGDPGRTLEDIQGFLRDRGYRVGRVAVSAHRHRWQKDLDDVKQCARFATSLMEIAESVPADTHNRGTLLGLDQVVLQQVFRLKDRKELNARDLAEWARTLESFVGVRDQIESIQRKAARASEKAAVRAAPAPASPRRIDGVAISDKVRRILGVPLPGEPLPQPPRISGATEAEMQQGSNETNGPPPAASPARVENPCHE